MKRFLLIIFTLISLNAFSQLQVKEGSFKYVPGGVIEDKEEYTDGNELPMALIKISTENINEQERLRLKFSGNRVTQIIKNPRTGQMWIYISAETATFINIMHPDYGTCKYYLPEDLCDYCVYEMVLQYVPMSSVSENAYLIIKTDQSDAEIFIDNEYVGKQFVHKQFAVGSTHTWKVKCDLFHTESGSLTITNEEKVLDLTLVPEYGFVYITTGKETGAKVYIDEKLMGETPYKSDKLSIGKYKVKVVKDLFKTSERTVTVYDKETTRADIDMLSVFVDVTVSVADNSSEVYIDDEFKSKGKWTGKLIEGSHVVEVRKANYRTEQKTIELVAGKKKIVQFGTPVAINGMLNVSSSPSGATVYIDEKNYGQTPIFIDPILIGTHTLKLEKQGCATMTKTITIKEGETLSLNEKLQSGKDIVIKTEKDGDKVYVDGKYVGLSPVKVNMSYDYHDLRIERDGKTLLKKINLSNVNKNVNVVEVKWNEYNGHEYVDLGLSVMWATCNVGANSPEECGDYYAWGETKTKNVYSFENSKTDDKEIADFSGDAQYDAATANWGGLWRMPTEAEAEELLRCKWEKVVLNDVNGYKVTGVNGNSIFIPKAGYISNEDFFDKDRTSWLWTSTPISYFRRDAYCMKGDSYTTYEYKKYGIPVRPVIDACGSIEVKNVLEGADVYINDKHYGTTPLLIPKIKIGEYDLKFMKIGFPTRTESITVKRDECSTIEQVHDWQYYKEITINTNYNGAKVYVDGSYAGNSPLKILLAYGTHVVKVDHKEGLQTQNILVDQHCSGVVNMEELIPRKTNGHEYVDLGLSVKWATCNVGANAPEQYGDYFAWGETKPKRRYTEKNSLTYCKTMGDISGNVNYDAATANWGGDWRMPTKSEMQELIDKCTWTRTTQNGVKGYEVTSKTNGNSIFLPAAGRIEYGKKNYDIGEVEYWTSTPSSRWDGVAYNIYYSSYRIELEDTWRYDGLSIRAVME